VLLLLEHAPLSRSVATQNPPTFSPHRNPCARSVEVFECNRGGDVTFHGRATSGISIFDLRSHSCSADTPFDIAQACSSAKTLPQEDARRRRLRSRLEEVLIRTCGDFGIPAKR